MIIMNELYSLLWELHNLYDIVEDGILLANVVGKSVQSKCHLGLIKVGGPDPKRTNVTEIITLKGGFYFPSQAY